MYFFPCCAERVDARDIEPHFGWDDHYWCVLCGKIFKKAAPRTKRPAGVKADEVLYCPTPYVNKVIKPYFFYCPSNKS